MKASHGDLRLMPRGALTKELMTEEVIDDDNDKEIANENLYKTERNETKTRENDIDKTEDMETMESLQACRKQNSEKDRGMTSIRNETIVDDICSEEQKVLQKLRDGIWNGTKPLNKLDSTPPQIIEKALQSENINNCTEAYRELDKRMIPKWANIITYHVVYNVRTDENGGHTTKSRTFPHVNKDKMKNEVRKLWSTAQFGTTIILLAIRQCSGK